MFPCRSNWTLADLGFSSSSSSSQSSASSSDASSVHGPILSLDGLHMTTVDNFWSLAMAAHYNGTVSPRLIAPDSWQLQYSCGMLFRSHFCCPLHH